MSENFTEQDRLNAEVQKLSAEVTKLNLEIEKIKDPPWRKSSFWIPIAALLSGVGAIIALIAKM